MWQYAARKWGVVRVLPDIAGYCRVVGLGDFFPVMTGKILPSATIGPF
jgi:hypothetical protein